MCAPSRGCRFARRELAAHRTLGDSKNTARGLFVLFSQLGVDLTVHEPLLKARGSQYLEGAVQTSLDSKNRQRAKHNTQHSRNKVSDFEQCINRILEIPETPPRPPSDMYQTNKAPQIA